MTAPDAIKPIKLMRKQYEFVHSNAPEILSSGAFGTGKTRGLCYRAVRLAQHPAARVGLCRLTHTALKRTTLATLLEPDGDLPPVLEPGSYTRRKAPGEEEVRLTNGGRILPFGCEDPVTIASLQLTDCCIDEGIELEEKHWNMLVGRCRVTYTLPDGSRNINTMATATNPGAPGHFLHKKFIALTEEQRQALGRHLIRTKTGDNFLLLQKDISLLRRLSRFTGAALLRYRDGVWCAHEGAIYPMFSDGVHVLHRPGPWVRFVAGVDYGFSHPSALRVQGLDGAGSSHVLAELYETGRTPDEFAEACQAATTVYSPITFVVDPSAPALIKALRQRGLHAIGGDNDVLGGIGKVQNALTPDPENDGQPRLTFEPTCARGTDEYLSYHWKEGALKEQPEKKDDHACDADRYAIMYIQRGAGTRRLRVVQPQGEQKKDLSKTHRQDPDGRWRPNTVEGLLMDDTPVPGFILP